MQTDQCGKCSKSIFSSATIIYA